MKRILLAYDGSGAAEQALVDLAQAGLPTNIDLLVLGVAEVWVPPRLELALEEEISLPATIRRARDKALTRIDSRRELVEQACQRLAAKFPHWTIEPATAIGWPPRTVADLANGWAADLVVTGSQRPSPLERLLRGSISHRIARLAPCSVRLARPRAQHDGLRICMILNGTPSDEVVLQAMTERAWPEGSTIQVLTTRPSGLVRPGASRPQESEADRERQADAEILEKAQLSLRQAGLAAEVSRLHKSGRASLVEQIQEWKADSVFLAAPDPRSKKTWTRLVHYVVARVDCSVEMVRPVLRAASSTTHHSAGNRWQRSALDWSREGRSPFPRPLVLS